MSHFNFGKFRNVFSKIIKSVLELKSKLIEIKKLKSDKSPSIQRLWGNVDSMHENKCFKIT